MSYSTRITGPANFRIADFYQTPVSKVENAGRRTPGCIPAHVLHAYDQAMQHFMAQSPPTPALAPPGLSDAEARQLRTSHDGVRLSYSARITTAVNVDIDDVSRN